MLTITIGLLLFTIFFLLSGIHFYWGLGGVWGASASVPTREDGKKVMNPKALDCFVVAIGLLAFGIFVLIKVQLVSFALPAAVLTYGLTIISAIFLLRAIGDFRYVGFFKKIRSTPFGKRDTRYYSPLCLFIGIMGIFLALYTPS